MTLVGFLMKALRVTRDVNAVRRGRIGARIHNRIVGKLVGRTTRKLKLWKR